MRRLSVREDAICIAVGALAGFGSRPRYARVSSAFLSADELGPAVVCMTAGVVAVLGLYAVLVWLKGW